MVSEGALRTEATMLSERLNNAVEVVPMMSKSDINGTSINFSGTLSIQCAYRRGIGPTETSAFGARSIHLQQPRRCGGDQRPPRGCFDKSPKRHGGCQGRDRQWTQR